MPSCFRILCYHVNIEFCKQEEEYIFFAGVGVGTDMQKTLFKKSMSLSAGTVRERESGEKMQRTRTSAGEGCLSPSIS